ncbi:MAG: glycoside hydrolase family 3 protein [Bdellovibrionaceae bacterium]|nr:glycoside hydrolase family 3 protein [Pseudobdellovibrionaceae bacterium]
MRQISLVVFCFFFSNPLWATEVDLPTESPLDKMTLEQKVGQMFMVGFTGKALSPKFKKHLQTIKPGAVIIFGRNIKTLKQISHLNSDLQRQSLAHTKVPLLIAVDQEGGGVARIHTSPALPSAYTIGQTNDPTIAFQAGKATGELLSLLGFNMNLAPVLDVTDNKLQSFIGPRSFSESPHQSGNMGVAFAQGLSEGHILPVAKHFPGHGPISLDSHHMTPTRNVSLNELLGADLIPFTQFAAASFSSGIMVAHIAYPLIDTTSVPATFSKTLVTSVLQDQLHYNGLIVTDDVEMGGAAHIPKLEDRAVAAILAGNDLIMFGWNQRAQLRARNAIIRAVKRGKISMDRLNHSVSKILAIKNKVAAPQTRSLAALTSLKADLKNIPYSQAYSEVFAHYFKTLPGLATRASQFSKFAVFSWYRSFSASFAKNIKASGLRSFKRSGIPQLQNNELLVFHVSNYKTLSIARALPEEMKRQTLVISSLPNFRFDDRNAFLEIIELYSYHPRLGAYAADAINRSKTSVSLLSW